MFLLTIASIFLVIIMAVGLFIKSEPILSQYNLWELLTESNWRPMEGKFGFLPFLAGTFWCTVLAILIALPISLLMAIYLTEYAHRSIRKYVYPLLDILAGLPSVIYGVWAHCSSCLGFRSMWLPSLLSSLRAIRFWRAASY